MSARRQNFRCQMEYRKGYTWVYNKFCVETSYLRMEDENGDIHCCLIFGKSRVALVKYVSIPRLELTAATLSVKISMMLKEELDIHITSESFWTDR